MKKLLFFTLVSLLFLSCKKENNSKEESITDFCSKIHRNNKVSLSNEIKSLDSLAKIKTGVYVLEEGGDAILSRAWLSEYAEKTIDIQYFIFSTDNIGLIACDYLVRAADNGVKVRIIVDDIMVNAAVDDILTLASHKNISIKIYNPGVNLGKSFVSKIKKFTTDFRGANQRMHNKTFIIDDKIVITGGRNIADEYFDYDHEYNFRDREVLLLGKVVKDVKTSFNNFWNSKLSVDVKQLIKSKSYDNYSFKKLHEYACNPENFWPQIRAKLDSFPKTIQKIKNSDKLVWVDSIAFVSDNPGKNDGTHGMTGGGNTTATLIELIKNAKKSIDIQSPYLVTSKLSRHLFENATKRGVKVRILTNSLASTDNLEAFASYQTDRKKLLETGIKIYEYKPNAAIRKQLMTGDLQKEMNFTPIFGLHAKSMIVDNSITIIGTFNLDPRSANLNTECITIIHSKKLSNQVLKGFEKEFKKENSWHTTLDFNPDKLVKRSKRIKTWTRKILPKSIL